MTAVGSAGVAARSSIALGEAIVTATLQFSVDPGVLQRVEFLL